MTVYSGTNADGRKLLRIEARNAETPIERKPPWIKTRMRTGPEYQRIKELVGNEGLHTVCQEAGCPNIFECWEDREATFLIGGEQCTRRCDFCQIDTGKPEPLDVDEPRRVADSVEKMELRYATVTGVARDDLEDEGSWLYAETVRQIHGLGIGTKVELLIPDFSANPALLGEVFDARPEVLAHNVETVPRIFKRIRPAFRYERSLDVLTQARSVGLVAKSNLILGMGETRDEVEQALGDLVEAGCELITITQYLRPSPLHHPVERWVHPEEFVELADVATELGFSGVMSRRDPRVAIRHRRAGLGRCSGTGLGWSRRRSPPRRTNGLRYATVVGVHPRNFHPQPPPGVDRGYRRARADSHRDGHSAHRPRGHRRQHLHRGHRRTHRAASHDAPGLCLRSGHHAGGTQRSVHDRRRNARARLRLSPRILPQGRVGPSWSHRLDGASRNGATR